jgi:hypothetical protein
MWTQVVGKVKLALATPVNHWWHVALYLGPRGLTTSSIPIDGGALEIEFDFIDHVLRLATSDGLERRIPLQPMTVAEFHRRVMNALAEVGVRVRIWTMPVEIENPIAFDRDEVHASYDAEYAERFWRVLLKADQALGRFRSGFLGKCSPVHFFWGSFDLAVTRFSGRRAPAREGADAITREAYSHEVSSAGFWPGGGVVADAAFYSYMAPEPPGFRDARVKPAAAFYSRDLNVYVLMYDAARSAASPDEAVRAFLQSTYDAGADDAAWDRAELERHALADTTRQDKHAVRAGD